MFHLLNRVKKSTLHTGRTITRLFKSKIGFLETTLITH